MKVLHLLYQSDPNISGSSTRSRNLLKAQIFIGLNPVALTSPFQSFQKSKVEVIHGVPYVRTTLLNSGSYVIGQSSMLKRINKIFYLFKYFLDALFFSKSKGFDVIHAHGNLFCGYVGFFVAKVYKLPFVYEVRSDWIQNSNFKAPNLLKKLLNFFEANLYRKTDHLVVISEGLHNLCSRYNKNITVIGNAVDLREVRLSSSELRGCLNFGYIGSVIELEGLNYVVEAFSKIPNVNLTIAGGGGALETLKEQAERLGAKNIRFLGFIGPAEIDDFYEQIDVVINYRRSEPVAHSVTPLKPLEAMARRKLVIVSDVGGMLELVRHSYNGLVVTSDSPEKLQETIIALQNGEYDVSRILDNAVEFLKSERSWEANAYKYKEIYSRLIDAKN